MCMMKEVQGTCHAQQSLGLSRVVNFLSIAGPFGYG